MKWFSYLLLISLAYGAIARGEQNFYDVHVSAFPDPERIIERGLPLCFDRSLVRNKLSDLESKSLAVEIVDVCTRVARLKGLNVVDSSKGRDCLHIGMEWDIGLAEKAKSCWKFFNSTFCSPHYDTVAYGKGVRFFIYDFGFRPAKQVSEIHSSMTSATKGFNRHTAEVLCRGAFHDYPRRLKDASYDVEPTFD